MATSKMRNRRRERSDAKSPRRAVKPVTNLSVPRYFAYKGVLDKLLAAFLLIPGTPLILVLMLVVRLTSRGPGIYRQRRSGKDGVEFFMYKIRTMVQDAEAATGPVWTQVSDSRVTAVGRVLRKLHLDELPQLVNVLKGEMSLVGPRPERPEFVKVLTHEIPNYNDRLLVNPGVTGMAQLNLPPDTDLASVSRKLVLDRDYIEQAGLLLDLRILTATFARMLRLSVALRLLGLERHVSQSTPGDRLAEDANRHMRLRQTPSQFVRSVAIRLSQPNDGHASNGTSRDYTSGHPTKGPRPR
jgi:lipopolysaccharide/colanic/teichoic acid biosynthesis glycosyltransferase